MAEHGLDGPVLGVAWDGTGLGEDGTIWGGEWLLCDRKQSRRVAHLRVLPMPGGERAVQEPWRMALAYLRDAGLPHDALYAPADERARRVVLRMLERDFNCPRTSSVGRLFDAVSSLCGVRHEAHYDGQAAIELEWLATRADSGARAEPYPFELAARSEGPLEIDTRPLICALVADLRAPLGAPVVARRFHATLGAMLTEVCVELRSRHGLSRVVLGGGVFANVLLVEEVERRLAQANFQVFRPHEYPPGDGGLSLGQLAIAAARDQEAS
jgi:hydrogenase maturation protein HypF